MITMMRERAAGGCGRGRALVGLLGMVGMMGGALGGLLGASTPRLALGQTITPVSPVAGGSIARLSAINANGTAAAGYSDNAGGQDVAIRWTSSGGTASIGFLPGGSINSYAQGMDNAGTTIVGYGDSGGVTRAFRWTTGAGYQILPYVSGTSGFNRANGVSGDGLIVTGVSGLGAAANGFTYYQSNGANFFFCGGSGAGNAGLAVSNDGSAMSGSCSNSMHHRTYVPNSAGSGNSVPGQLWSMGEAISANGTVITGRYGTAGGEFGFRWSRTTAPFVTILPQTPSGCTALRPRAISGDANLIIGQVVDNTAGFTCFVWTPARGTRLLSEHLTLRGINLAGWTLTDATGISSDGSAMCGNGIFNGQALGWVVRGLTCNSLNGPPGLTATGPCVGGSSTMGGFGFSFQNGTTPYFRWFRNGVEIIPGVQPSGSTIAVTNSASLTITNQQYADAGSYTVAISAQGACEVVSAPYAFSGPGTLSPSVDPATTSACIGQNPSLFAVPSSPNVPPSSVVYRWQKLVTAPNVYADIFDGPSGNGGSYFGTGTSTFSIFNAQPADSTRYRCVFSILGCGPSTNVISANALLTVLPNTSILVDPVPQSACPGASFVFFTAVAAPVGQGFTYQWQRHQPPFPNVYVDITDGPSGFGGTLSGTTTTFLGISNPTGGDFDRYRCVATGPCGFAATSNNAMLSVTPAPLVTSGPTQTGGCQGGTASLAVTASPAGSTYQWQQYIGPCILCYQNVNDGPTGNGGTFSGATSATLTITGFDLFDTFLQYRCLVTGPCGGVPAASPLVQFALTETPSVQTQPTGGNICPNGSRTLTVALAPGNYGTLSYQWWRYTAAGPIFAPVGNGTYVTGSVAAGATTPALTISNFKPGDTGQYYCKVDGDCGSTFSTVVNLTHCPPDYNCDGLTNVSDIFDFLAGWFAGNPNANFNGTGGIGVADIFAFLNAWFVGC